MTEDIKYFMSPEGDEPFWLEMVGISYCDGSYVIQRKNAGMYVFEYILSGTGSVRVGSKEYTASEGDCYILRKGTDHKYWCGDRNPWTKVFFNVGGELVERLLDAYGLLSRGVVHRCDVKEEFLAVYKLSRQNAPVEELTRACALKLHAILQTIYAQTRDVPELSPEAAALKQFLDARVGQKVTIEEMAAGIYRSRDYTIKLFKREFGQTPYAYLIGKKMDMAKSFLKSTTLSVKQIAFNLGYDDQHYFSNIFKKETGMSPRQYREHH